MYVTAINAAYYATTEVPTDADEALSDDNSGAITNTAATSASSDGYGVSTLTVTLPGAKLPSVHMLLSPLRPQKAAMRRTRRPQ